MKVRRLTISNFRGVAHGVVIFNGHTLLVGGNNAGKTTICEALYERPYGHYSSSLRTSMLDLPSALTRIRN